MNHILYKVGRRPYVVSRFVETGECAEITSPFLISQDGRGYVHGGHGLLRQAFRLPAEKVKVLLSVEKMETTMYLQGDIVSRMQKSIPLIMTDVRRAWLYDCRVCVGDINMYVSSVEFVAQNGINGLEVSGKVRYCISEQKDSETYAKAFSYYKKKLAEAGRELSEQQFLEITNQNPKLITEYISTDESAKMNSMLATEFEIIMGKTVLLPKLELLAEISQRSLFVGYSQEFFTWKAEPYKVETIGMTEEEARIAGKTIYLRTMHVMERDFEALFKKQKRSRKGEFSLPAL